MTRLVRTFIGGPVDARRCEECGSPPSPEQKLTLLYEKPSFFPDRIVIHPDIADVLAFWIDGGTVGSARWIQVPLLTYRLTDVYENDAGEVIETESLFPYWEFGPSCEGRQFKLELMLKPGVAAADFRCTVLIRGTEVLPTTTKGKGN